MILAASDATVALVATIPALVGPIVLAIILGIQRRSDKRLDWEREDTLADRAEEAAEKAAKAADAVEAHNKVAVETAAETQGQLREIHWLVNSSMTAALESELLETESSLALMREVIDLKEALGREPTPEALEAIAHKEGKIEELKATIMNRYRAENVADRRQRGRSDPEST